MSILDHVAASYHATASSAASYASSAGIGLYGLMTMENAGVVVGILAAVITCTVNVIAAYRRDKRGEAQAKLDAEVSAARLAEVKAHANADIHTGA
jgi:hypothetical protein